MGDVRPRIGITLGLEGPDPKRELFRNKPLQYLEEGMILAVARAGGLPCLLPDLKDETLAAQSLATCDGLLLSGGSDVSPIAYGEEPRAPAWRGDPPRDVYELALLQAAIEARLPALGICRGCQLINVACGGTLWQDIASEIADAVCHRDTDAYDGLVHEVSLAEGSLLAEWFGATSLRVNSVHHQAIRAVGHGLRVSARASDGVIEAVESTSVDRLVVGVQWHPEWMSQDAADPVLAAFVARCRTRSR